MACYCFLYNVTEKCVALGNQKRTPYESRFSDVFLEQDILQFGCEVEYKPSNPDYKEAQHTFGTQLRSGIFMGYSLNQGGKWNGDYLVADIDDFVGKDLGYDAPPSHFSKIYPHVTRKVYQRPEHATIFPLKLKYDRCNRTLEGREETWDRFDLQVAQNSVDTTELGDKAVSYTHLTLPTKA